MDNEQLLNEIQKLLEGMEQRTDAKFAIVNIRLESMDHRLDSMDRQLTLQNELLSPFIRWSHQVEEEVIRLSVELATVKNRLEKLEHPEAPQ